MTFRTRNVAAQQRVEVTLVDSGVGCEQAMLQRMFDPLVTTRGHGLGLGLAICRNIVTLHGGEIKASANDDHGLTLHITLPALAA